MNTSYFYLLELYEKHEYAKFIYNFNKYINKKTNVLDVNLLFKYTKILIGSNKFDEAIKVLQIINKLDSNSKYAYLELARVYALKNNFSLAEQYYLKYIILDCNKRPKIRVELANFYIKNNQSEKAIDQFIKCINIDPNNMYYYIYLGRLYISLKRYNEAEQVYLKCIEIDKDIHSHPRLDLSRLYYLQGKNKSSQKQFNKYKEILEKNDSCNFYYLEGNTPISNFIVSPKTLLNQIKLEETPVINAFGCSIYCFYSPKCGYSKDKKGATRIYDYVTFVTLPDKINDIITIFPSDKVIKDYEIKRKK